MDEENKVLGGDPTLYGVIPVPEELLDFSRSSGCIAPYLQQTMTQKTSEAHLQQKTSVLNTLVQPVLSPQDFYKNVDGDNSQTQVTWNSPVPLLG